MAQELKQIENLVNIASSIIETPALALKDFGIKKDPRTLLLTYTGDFSAEAAMKYAALNAASSTFTGVAVIVSSPLLTIGVATVAPWANIALNIGYMLYRKKKRERQEKERMYREIIAKQQAAIKRQKEINGELEECIRTVQQNDAQSRITIDELRQKIANLTELIEVLTEQQGQFKVA